MVFARHPCESRDPATYAVRELLNKYMLSAKNAKGAKKTTMEDLFGVFGVFCVLCGAVDDKRDLFRSSLVEE